MSEYAEKVRKSRDEKLKSYLRTDPKMRVDASGYTPPDALEADVQTGPRPVSRRQFKRGGHVEGAAPKMRADRRPRKAGGGPASALTPDNLQNRDLKEANQERNGSKHVGGMKRGGAAHPDEAQDKKLIRSMMHKEGCECGRCSGGRAGRKEGGGNWIAGAIKHPGALHKALHVPEGEKIPQKKLNKAAHSDNPALAKKANLAKTLGRLHKSGGGPGEDDGPRARAAGGSTTQGTKLDGTLQGTRPTGGRLARKEGGRTSGKGKMNVNIIIGAPSRPQVAPMPPQGRPMMPPGGPAGLHQGAPPAPPQMPPGAAMPPGGAMPGAAMPRRSGGRAGHYEAGAGSGEGRLEKIKNYGGV